MDLGPYDVQFSDSGYQAEPTLENVVSVIIAVTPEIEAIVSLETIPHEIEFDELMRYTKHMYFSELARLYRQGASLISGPHGHIINGRPGFEMVFTFPQTLAVVVGFWLEGDDTIFIFAKAPNDSNLRDKIFTLAQNIIVTPI